MICFDENFGVNRKFPPSWGGAFFKTLDISTALLEFLLFREFIFFKILQIVDNQRIFLLVCVLAFSYENISEIKHFKKICHDL